ncbi:MAG: ferredoxin [Rhodococcus sp. (in: high G+C Gram-positive bacteria)]|uniref:ferredoxin n=1 Tax=Rhodococcus sp. TaxID=1831 RepID=UPI002AD84274|nr:ferredoxin [Rhodococcus sp. (in: high G+C Gram-positive bacteria)]
MSRPPLHIDPALCEGFGFCYSVAPTLLREGEDGQTTVVDDAPPVEDSVLDELVEQCPRAALRRVWDVR